MPSTVRGLADRSESPEVKRLAATALENYRPLVTLLVFTNEGELLARREVNKDVLEPLWRSEKEGTAQFMKFLTHP